MLPMLEAKMMARMMQHTMIMIFFCTGGERGAVRRGHGWHRARGKGQGLRRVDRGQGPAGVERQGTGRGDQGQGLGDKRLAGEEVQGLGRGDKEQGEAGEGAQGTGPGAGGQEMCQGGGTRGRGWGERTTDRGRGPGAGRRDMLGWGDKGQGTKDRGWGGVTRKRGQGQER